MSTDLSWLTRRWGLALALAAAACAPGDTLLQPGLAPPVSVTATPLNLSSIRVDWVPGASVDLQNYRIERRVAFQGRFERLGDVNPATTSYFDTGLSPGTFYGYRIIAVSRAGEQSEPSVVAGAHTAPLPGIRYSTALTATEVTIADPNGYRLTFSGPAETTLSVGTLDDGLVSPLPAGLYTVTLSDVLPTCRITNDTVRQVTVVDTGLATQSSVSFDAVCTDPTKGDVFAEVTVQGDSVDPDGYTVEYAGILPGDTVPALGGTVVGGIGGSFPFHGLTPGDYEISIRDVDPPCAASGPTTASVQVAPLSRDTVRFAVTCPDKGGGNASAPLVFRNTWSPQAAAVGQTATLDVVLDLSARPAQDLGVIQARLRYDPAVLTYQSATAPSPGQLGGLTVNAGTPGTLTWVNFSTAATPPTGVIPAARFTFLVGGTSGAQAVTRSTIELVSDFAGAVALDTLFRIVEDTFAVSTGSGGSNVAPTAHANGPYSGTPAAAISFSSAGSSDPDGSIAGYSWSFGDGGTSSQPNPTHSYAAAGGYTAILTVTDNLGLTGTSQATVTVSGGGGNTPPTAVPGGPYSGTAGAIIIFSAAGSTDPDGSIASYSWNFGDGGTSTQANPTHSYAAAGSYTASLTVTDNLGATGSAQASVSVTPASATPFTWTSAFGAFESALGTYPLVISLNLAADIPETSGPEALGSYVVDSLVWDPAVLEYHSLAFGSGGGSFNTTNATGGCKCKLLFNGSPTSNTGVVTLATVRFRPVGAASTSTTTRTSLGPVLSTAALGSFNYRSRIQVVEGTITLP